MAQQIDKSMDRKLGRMYLYMFVDTLYNREKEKKKNLIFKRAIV